MYEKSTPNLPLSGKELLVFSLLILLTVQSYSIGAVSAEEYDGSLVFALFNISPSQISIWRDYGAAEAYVLSTLYVGLYRLDHDGKLIPELADGMPSINNGIWTVKLRSLLKFSDGTPLTADDVVFSYKVYLTPNINNWWYSELKQYIPSNTSVQKVDDLTVSFDVGSDSFAFNKMLTPWIAPQKIFQPMYDKCLVDQYQCSFGDSTNAIGAGPFEILSPTLDSTNITVIKNPYYWNEDSVQIDEITFFPYSGNDIGTLYKEGKIDLVEPGFLPSNTDKINNTYVEEPATVSIALNHVHPYYGTGAMIPDNGSKIVSTEDAVQARLVRQALDYTVRREEVAKVNFMGGVLPASNFFPTISYGYTNMSYRPFSIDEARNLMEMAGFNYSKLGQPDTNGYYSNFFFNVTVMAPVTCPARNKYHSTFADDLLKIGVGTTVYEASWEDVISRSFGYNGSTVPVFDEGGYDMLFLGWSVGRSITGVDFLNSEINNVVPGDNFTNYNNASFNSAYALGMNSTTFDEYQTHIAHLEKIMYDDVPIISIVHPLFPVPTNDNLTLDPLDFLLTEVNWADVKVKGFVPTSSTTSETDDTSQVTSSSSGSQTTPTSTTPLSIPWLSFTLIVTPLIFLRKKRKLARETIL